MVGLLPVRRTRDIFGDYAAFYNGWLIMKIVCWTVVGLRKWPMKRGKVQSHIHIQNSTINVNIQYVTAGK